MKKLVLVLALLMFLVGCSGTVNEPDEPKEDESTSTISLDEIGRASCRERVSWTV